MDQKNLQPRNIILHVQWRFVLRDVGFVYHGSILIFEQLAFSWMMLHTYIESGLEYIKFWGLDEKFSQSWLTSIYKETCPNTNCKYTSNYWLKWFQMSSWIILTHQQKKQDLLLELTCFRIVVGNQDSFWANSRINPFLVFPDLLKDPPSKVVASWKPQMTASVESSYHCRGSFRGRLVRPQMFVGQSRTWRRWWTQNLRLIFGWFPKIGGVSPKMDGENNGKPCYKWMILGYPYFRKHPCASKFVSAPQNRKSETGKWCFIGDEFPLWVPGILVQGCIRFCSSIWRENRFSLFCWSWNLYHY